MNLYYSTTNPKKLKNKINYISPNLIRLTYLIKLNPVHHFSEKKIYNRASVIPSICLGNKVSIHTGRSFRAKNINKWMLGFKFGEFTLTRKRALYKSKQKKKKKIKFEHILQIYWSKGLFFGGKLFYINKTFSSIFNNTPGLGISHKNSILKRLELPNSISVNTSPLTNFKARYNRNIIGFLNNYYSQVTSVNTTSDSLLRLNIIRLYLIKSYRGYCHSLGKPVRGQRTWSNSWNSFNQNYTLRRFISQYKFKLGEGQSTQKINYKMTKKKYISKKKKKSTIIKKKIWY